MIESILDFNLPSFSFKNDIRAFLLSESSLIVSKRRFIIKTCGTTKCLQSLEGIIELAKTYCGLEEVQDIFYSSYGFYYKIDLVERTVIENLWPYERPLNYDLGLNSERLSFTSKPGHTEKST